MYINSTDRNSRKIPTRPKKTTSTGENSFAEEVEAVLELDAVELTNSKKDGEGSSKKFSKKEKQHPAPTSRKPGALDLTA